MTREGGFMRQVRILIAGAVTLVLMPAGLAGQGEYRKPACELPRGHFLVQQAETYFKGAVESARPPERQQLLADARRSVLEALQRGETENAAVWYFLGRVYFEQDDALGADSAFAAAERLLPGCAEDIRYYRRLLWVQRINRAVDTLRAGDFDAAKEILREANRLDQSENVGFYYLGRIFANEAELDSAKLYFQRVAEMPVTDTTRAANRLDAIASLAKLHFELEEWDSAAVWYERLREAKPRDPEALVNLAQAYAEAGDQTRASALYDTVFAMAEAMSADDLFRAAESLYSGRQYLLAARAYRLGLEKNPYAGRARVDLANAYRAVALDPQAPAAQRREASRGMLAAARELVREHPLNAEAIRLLAAAYQLTGHSDSTDIVLAALDQLDVELEILQAERVDGGYVVQGLFKNRRDRQLRAPIVTFEFLDASGNVVDRQQAGGMALAGRRDAAFSLTATGDIVGYRYRTQ